jgi:hypothetical protein
MTHQRALSMTLVCGVLLASASCASQPPAKPTVQTPAERMREDARRRQREEDERRSRDEFIHRNTR